ncbi:hypothetical protein FRACYDRAFT_237076 [Fragilariopsis cylindrus CCMP1102]|uniref:Uncharacterized protein n=1 Tax=Fragilariopsis cylindrus CCMP1102 TaxID=635003 RepID=A0A1E7FKX1_9STRA|nr:hypothetical protein FRACYDRAFT_237076 [Fragilariopsis cylindrus CCMP1102]|eukprot:OEU18796.1 hypothetical protein FRACYDRAFT_237076 [Fragilariopsis cylindrus CCMP1102]
MDDDNIDNEENHQAAQDEQQRQRQQHAFVLLKKMTMVLEQKETFPLQTRNKTDELVENFLENLEDDIHDMLCSGLDSDRETEAEVEAIVRVFPEVLTRRKEDDEDQDPEHGSLHYPIQLLALVRKEVGDDEEGDWQCNPKAIAFVPLVSRLAIEFGLFEEKERGGLLYHGCFVNNVIQNLIRSDETELPNQEHHEYVDTKYLQVLIRLRRLGLLKIEDIQNFGLLIYLCRLPYFAEKRCCFLVEWDPSALTKTDRFGQLPIHFAAELSSIRGFELVFEYGIRYYPKKKGISLLFRKSNNDFIPFVEACMKFGEEQVMKMIEDTFIRCYSSSDDTPPLNVVEALMTAAVDEDIHLDCVYFLLRRQPDILQKLLSSASITTIATATANMVEFNSNNSSISPKKRKRKNKQKVVMDGCC